MNSLVLQGLPALMSAVPNIQFLHLTGPQEIDDVRAAYAAAQAKAVVLPFLTEMELALGAATVAVSRAGASSLAELAAMRVPSVLIPYPISADHHQFYNARALADAGAALLLEQADATGEKLASSILKLLQNQAMLVAMREELVRWHSPKAAEQIVDKIVAYLKARGQWRGGVPEKAARVDGFGGLPRARMSR